MKRTLLAIASPRSGTMVSMQNDIRTVSAARSPTKSIQVIGRLPLRCAGEELSSAAHKRSAGKLVARPPARAKLLADLISIGLRRHFRRGWTCRSAGQVLGQARE